MVVDLYVGGWVDGGPCATETALAGIMRTFGCIIGTLEFVVAGVEGEALVVLGGTFITIKFETFDDNRCCQPTYREVTRLEITVSIGGNK